MYRRGIVVREVAEALLSLDIGTSADFVRTFLACHDFDVVGVSKEGHLIGYVDVHKLTSEPLMKSVQGIKITQVLSDDTPIAELIEVLSVKERVFVRSLGTTAGIATRADLQKLPVRMWLFGMVSVLEMELLRILKQYFPGDTWKQHLTPGHVGQATRFYNLNKVRNQQASLVDYIGLIDKYAVLKSRSDLLRRLGLSDHQKSDALFKTLYDMRNDLAHANRLSIADWPKLAQTISKLLDVVGKASSI
jgi:hypothetical protein